MDKCVIVYSTIHLARVYLHRRRKFLSMRKFQDASFLSLLVYIYTPLFRSAFLSFKARCILSSKKKKKKTRCISVNGYNQQSLGFFFTEAAGPISWEEEEEDYHEIIICHSGPGSNRPPSISLRLPRTEESFLCFLPPLSAVWELKPYMCTLISVWWCVFSSFSFTVSELMHDI